MIKSKYVMLYVLLVCGYFGIRVYLMVWSDYASKDDTHSATLINIKPIEKPKVPVSKSELLTALKNADFFGSSLNSITKLIERIEKAGIAEGSV